MKTIILDDFKASADTLRIYLDGDVIFRSAKQRLLPLLDYILLSGRPHGVEIMDRITGNAAALLCIKADCRAVYSPMGSELAASTLRRYQIDFSFEEITPRIIAPTGEICPMEELSLDKDPEEFYSALSRLMNGLPLDIPVDA